MADKKKDLNKFLFTTQANILRNVDYLPVSVWGFEDGALDIIKKQKHAAVNQKLSKKQQKTFDNAKKQQLAQKMGAVPQTISEIYKILSNSKLANKMPARPKVNVVKKVNSDETKENGGPEIDSEVLEILKKKGVGKRPFVRSVTSNGKKNAELDEDGVPFKKGP
ncbi:hypothetical protein M3Y97_00584100 [Aphelenchoides bicaudatus]|nr:hypothetical protein M3Y97_00584100 [Aphelenchoides bicaudatus]